MVGIDAEAALGLVDDHPEELRAVVRGGQPSGDAEDRVETLRELGLEVRVADRGSAIRRASEVDVGRSAPTIRRRIDPARSASAFAGSSGRPSTTRTGTGGIAVRLEDARARFDRRIRRPLRGAAIGPGAGEDHRLRVDPSGARGLHSGGVAAPRGPGRQIPHPRSHTPSWTTVPVPSAAIAAVITAKPGPSRR